MKTDQELVSLDNIIRVIEDYPTSSQRCNAYKIMQTKVSLEAVMSPDGKRIIGTKNYQTG